MGLFDCCAKSSGGMFSGLNLKKNSAKHGSTILWPASKRAPLGLEFRNRDSRYARLGDLTRATRELHGYPLVGCVLPRYSVRPSVRGTSPWPPETVCTLFAVYQPALRTLPGLASAGSVVTAMGNLPSTAPPGTVIELHCSAADATRPCRVHEDVHLRLARRADEDRLPGTCPAAL